MQKVWDTSNFCGIGSGFMLKKKILSWEHGILLKATPKFLTQARFVSSISTARLFCSTAAGEKLPLSIHVLWFDWIPNGILAHECSKETVRLDSLDSDQVSLSYPGSFLTHPIRNQKNISESISQRSRPL